MDRKREGVGTGFFKSNHRGGRKPSTIGDIEKTLAAGATDRGGPQVHFSGNANEVSRAREW